MSKRKKICLVIPSLNAGGMERVIVELASFFSIKSDIETYFIIYTRGEKFFQIPENIHLIEPDFSFKKSQKFLYTIKTLWFLRKNLKIIKPDAVLSFGETYNSFVLLSALFLKTRIFVSDRSKPDKSWGIFHETLRKLIYKKATGIVSQTSFSKDFLGKETKHKNIAIIPNPVKPLKTPSTLQNKIILTVGRLISTKKIDLLLQIFAEVKTNDWKLWIIGDGPEKQVLEELAFKLGINETVKFWGFQKDIETFYSKAGIFAFSSVSEGFPNALLEAMAAGLPCVSFDCVAGPTDLIKNGENGFLIPLFDTVAYKKQLNHLMENESARLLMGKKAYEKSKKYELEKIGNAYLNFLLS
jgi:GalNAc-alpha-(1->4)-GalNAc-alpha-(1->3)-diNAcBac-PP-undecaprenol alpha-1,4-N-acetyl-D-galactosaminyltransferase